MNHTETCVNQLTSAIGPTDPFAQHARTVGIADAGAPFKVVPHEDAKRILLEQLDQARRSTATPGSVAALYNTISDHITDLLARAEAKATPGSTTVDRINQLVMLAYEEGYAVACDDGDRALTVDEVWPTPPAVPDDAWFAALGRATLTAAEDQGIRTRGDVLERLLDAARAQGRAEADV